MSEFDFKKELEASMAFLNELWVDMHILEQIERDKKEFDEAWDKRTQQVTELEKLYKL